MRQQYLVIVSGIIVLSFAEAAIAQQTTTRTEVGSDGQTYLVTERKMPHTVAHTEYETRTERTYHPQVTSQVHSYQQLYAVPKTEYRMVSRYRGWWNPFARPYWTHNLEPVTRWDYQTATVQVPVSQTTWAEGTRTVQVPVTKYKTADQIHITKVPVSGQLNSNSIDSLGPTPTTPIIAGQAIDGRYGSQRLSSDIPRTGTTIR